MWLLFWRDPVQLLLCWSVLQVKVMTANFMCNTLFVYLFVSILSFFPVPSSGSPTGRASTLQLRVKISTFKYLWQKEISTNSIFFLQFSKVTVQPQLLYLWSFTCQFFVAQPAVWIPHSALFLIYIIKKGKIEKIFSFAAVCQTYCILKDVKVCFSFWKTIKSCHVEKETAVFFQSAGNTSQYLPHGIWSKYFFCQFPWRATKRGQ